MQIVCRKYCIPLTETKDEFERLLREKLEELIKIKSVEISAQE